MRSASSFLANFGKYAFAVSSLIEDRLPQMENCLARKKNNKNARKVIRLVVVRSGGSLDWFQKTFFGRFLYIANNN
jgi:hypothetical protein